MKRIVRYGLGALWACLQFLVPSGATAANAGGDPSLHAGVRQLLEDVEQTRMLLGATLWQVHDLRGMALSGEGDLAALESIDRENLRLYEALKPLDFAAASLLAAVEFQDPGKLDGDLTLLRGELPAVAAQALAQFRSTSAECAKRRDALLAAETKSGLVIAPAPLAPWRNPVREYQRQAGAQIGWRTNLEPGDNFREAFWNQFQGLDIRYQLAKGRMVGVDFIVPKDPILRWDWIEPEAGRFDFARLDRAMALAAEHGMKVKLVLPTMGGRVPDWVLKEHPESVIRDAKGSADSLLNGGTFAHDFMGPIDRKGPWYERRAVNLTDKPTRQLFARYVNAIAAHCRKMGYIDRILAIAADQPHAQRHWLVPGGTAEHDFVIAHYKAVAEIAGKAFTPVPLDLEVADGEAHVVDGDMSAHEWRSAGLAAEVSLPGVDSETPFFEDLMRAVALQASGRAGQRDGAGPFFYQNCEYGFGCMLSVNFFTALLRDGLWSDGWFGPEGYLRWGYFPQIMTWNDRQLQWSGITNGWLALRQAHLLGPTLANTRVTPADALLLLPSSTFEVKGSRANRELIGWGWALTALKIQYDVITEAELARGVPERARLLILPQAVVLRTPHVAAIRTFVQRGGLLFASLVPGTDGAQPSPLAEVVGCDVLQRDGKPVLLAQTGVKGTWWQTTVNRGMHSGKYTPVPAPDTGYPRKVEGRRQQYDQPYQALAAATPAESIATFGSGESALVLHAFGKGKALTSGYPFGQELVFADWTSIAFGKIYNGWAREEQMLGMLRELRTRLAALGYESTLRAPEGWRHRLQGFEAAASSISYPKGPPAGAAAYLVTKTYLDARPDHRITQEHDDLDYAMELTWRDRPGVATRFLAVANRESAYAGERAVVQSWMMPHIVRIHIADPTVRRIYDVAAGVPVRFERDATGVSFRATIPPAEGRVFAVSATDRVELFALPAKIPGVAFNGVAAAVEKIAANPAKPAAGALVCEPDAILAWLRQLPGRKATICCGDETYRSAAAKLQTWLKAAGLEVEIVTADGTFEITGNENFQAEYRPSPAQILIGNAWSNNAIASLDCAWPYNAAQAPATLSGRFTATYAWPGGDRGLVALTRELEFRKADGSAWSLGYGNTDGYAVRPVDDAKQPHLRRRLLLLASTPAGADAAVAALVQAAPVQPSP